jgi:hypothetical protein
MSELARARRTVPRRVLASQQRFNRVGVDAARQRENSVDAVAILLRSPRAGPSLGRGWSTLLPPKLAMMGGPVANSVVPRSIGRAWETAPMSIRSLDLDDKTLSGLLSFLGDLAEIAGSEVS